ncbi:hypothetical protein BGY98DRAFT_979862 [Russula aff. rugulosa BPL654]|nr:hypothetical protein BGY98DRAFT_979862 [Russula aff. rugulosa BPL654]
MELLYSSLYRASLTPSFYFDSLYCSALQCRSFYPLMALHSPEVYAQIVDSLGIDLAELYAAQVTDAEVNPPGSSWNVQGRQSNIYK